MSIESIGKRDKGRALVAVLALTLLAAACGGSKASSTTAAAAAAPVTVRLGYFPNITHAPALVGISDGTFARDLGPDKLDASQTFNAGPAEVEALLSGAIDIGFIGPSPASFGPPHGWHAFGYSSQHANGPGPRTRRQQA